MNKITIFALSIAFIFGTLSAEYRGGSNSSGSQPYQGQFQQKQKSSQHVSDCPACRAKAGKNYYRLKKPEQPR